MATISIPYTIDATGRRITLTDLGTVIEIAGPPNYSDENVMVRMIRKEWDDNQTLSGSVVVTAS